MKKTTQAFTLQLFADAAPEGAAPEAAAIATDGTNAPSGLAPAAPASDLPAENDLETLKCEASDAENTAPAVSPQAAAPVPSAPPDAALREHFDALTAQAAELQKTFPGFRLEEELKNPVFLRMTAPGVNIPLADAYFALHHKELQAAAMQVTAQMTAQKLAASVQAGALRPDETGGAQAPSVTAFSYASASRRQREALKQKIRAAAAHGKRIFP